MTPRQYWNEYVDRQGGNSELSRRTGIPYSTLAGVSNGTRGIGKKLAQRLKESDPLIDAAHLVWVQPTDRAA